MRKCIAFIPTGVIGMTLLILGFLNIVDSFWTGMGTALLFVSVLRLIRISRYNKDADYKEKIDIAANDERNKYIRSTAWAWAGYLFIITAAILAIVARLLGQVQLSVVCGGAVSLMVLLYWISYFILRKKY